MTINALTTNWILGDQKTLQCKGFQDTTTMVCNVAVLIVTECLILVGPLQVGLGADSQYIENDFTLWYIEHLLILLLYDQFYFFYFFHLQILFYFIFFIYFLVLNVDHYCCSRHE